MVEGVNTYTRYDGLSELRAAIAHKVHSHNGGLAGALPMDQVSAVAAPHARLLIGGLDPGEQFGVQGITRAEIERRFTPAWTLLSAGDAPEMARFGKGHYSLLQPRQ